MMSHSQRQKTCYSFYWMLILCFTFSCSKTTSEKESNSLTTAFTKTPVDQSGIDFNNTVVQNENMNIFTNQYTLNGGGVAVGDLNNDGFPDLYFIANQKSNKLYLNKKELQFEDITDKSGVSGNAYWATGAVIIDINNDGWNDIYVAYAGNYLYEPQKLANELFINNGDANQNDGIPTFTEQAGNYGLASTLRTIQPVFFDYDNDNDLDLYLVNHPFNFFLPLDMRLSAEKYLPKDATDQLFKNNGDNTFTDVTYTSGIANFAFGLSASVGDLNGDGWMDLYVANDFSEKDAYLQNNGDGTFSRKEDSAFFHISNFSMGSDIADFNNDLLPDLFVVDMSAEDNRRKKENMSAMDPKSFWSNVALNRHYQYMQNVLQLNNGNGTFSDVAELAQVAHTDWSWSILFGDLDNDGWKDLYITNGLPIDFRNADVNKKWDSIHTLDLRKEFQSQLNKLPSEAIPNYAFKNKGDLTFTNITKEWNLEFKGFSNGLAMVDLDRDGDLDLVMNNLNDTACLYENQNITNGNFLQIKPQGPLGNKAGIGVTVKIFSKENQQMQQLSLAKGYQSGGEALLHFGLGTDKTVDSIKVIWPDGKKQMLTTIQANQLLNLNYSEAKLLTQENVIESKYLAEIINPLEDYSHKELEYDDYINEILLPHKYSQLGPKIALGDVNGDGKDDLLVGGSYGFSAQLFLQTKYQQFELATEQPWEQHKVQEDIGILFFDVDNDEDLDVYLSSGSNEWKPNSIEYRDRLYINDGNGNFQFAQNALPDIRHSSSCVKAADFDQDGDLDLFVGGRLVPGAYPTPASSVLLENKGGFFTDVTSAWCPELSKLGMVTAAEWIDINEDGFPDLSIAGEWMPITLFKNSGKEFTNVTENSGLAEKVGWWYSLHQVDVDKDGDMDLIAGNLGLNAKYKGTEREPFQVYYADFDSNGKHEIVLGYYNQGIPYPLRGRSCSAQQLPQIEKQFPSYKSFSTATLIDVYGSSLDSSLHYEANWMASSYLENLGSGTFKIHALPNEAQLSVVKGIIHTDLNKDGHVDLILAGNMYQAEVETQRHDASIGSVLVGDGKGGFSPIPWSQSGFSADGDVKDLKLMKDQTGSTTIVIGVNNSPVRFYRQK